MSCAAIADKNLSIRICDDAKIANALHKYFRNKSPRIYWLSNVELTSSFYLTLRDRKREYSFWYLITCSVSLDSSLQTFYARYITLSLFTYFYSRSLIFLSMHFYYWSSLFCIAPRISHISHVLVFFSFLLLSCFLFYFSYHSIIF